MIGLLLAIVLLLSACDGDPVAIDPATVSPAAKPSPTTPATTPATASPATPPPATELATAPPRDPATLAPVTRRPATVEAQPTKPQPTFPAPASPTVEIGKLPPLGGGSPEPEAPAEWTSYTHSTYGFTFSYPRERWIVLERPNDPHGLALAYHESGIALRMRFARADENADLQLYGGAAGDFVPQGTVRFMGKEVERTPLIYRDATTRVFYNDTKPIPRGDMLFSFALVYSQANGNDSLPEAVQAEADRIIESFRLDD